MTQLTTHFSLAEMTLSQTAARMGLNNIPAPTSQEYKNLIRTAKVMEQARVILDNYAILISSGYRSPQVNAAVGGSKNSEHMKGLAVDFTCPSYGTPHRVCRALANFIQELGIDQLIYEFDTWCHLGLSEGKPRYMKLTIDTKGTRQGF